MGDTLPSPAVVCLHKMDEEVTQHSTPVPY
jgi:hypothetical protein